MWLAGDAGLGPCGCMGHKGGMRDGRVLASLHHKGRALSAEGSGDGQQVRGGQRVRAPYYGASQSLRHEEGLSSHPPGWGKFSQGRDTSHGAEGRAGAHASHARVSRHSHPHDCPEAPETHQRSATAVRHTALHPAELAPHPKRRIKEAPSLSAIPRSTLQNRRHPCTQSWAGEPAANPPRQPPTEA